MKTGFCRNPYSLTFATAMPIRACQELKALEHDQKFSISDIL